MPSNRITVHFIKYFLFCSFLVQFSCSNTNIIDKAQDIHINNASLPDSSDISAIVDSVRVLRLFDAPHKALGSINQLYVVNGQYIAFDLENTKRINAYDANGKYLKTMMENGPQSGDGLSLIDCYANEKDEIIVYDYAQMKLSTFDSELNAKTAIKGKRLYHYNHIASLPGTHKFVGFTSDNLTNAAMQHQKNTPSSVDFLDDKLQLLKKEFIYPKKFDGISLFASPKSFFAFKDSLRFFRFFDSYVYSMENDEIERRYKITYDKGNFPQDFLMTIVDPHYADFNVGNNGVLSAKAQYKYFNGYSCLLNWLENDSLAYASSITFSNGRLQWMYSIIKKGKNPLVSTSKALVERSRFKITLPPFDAYDRKSKEFVAYTTGNRLKKYLLKNSQLIKSNKINDESFYLIAVRFKSLNATPF